MTLRPIVVFARAGQAAVAPLPPSPPVPLPEGAYCPPCASLPSAESADALVRGRPDAIFAVLRDFAGRTALVAIGMAVAGFSPVLGPAAAGAAGIEVFVLAYRAWKNAQPPAPPTAAR